MSRRRSPRADRIRPPASFATRSRVVALAAVVVALALGAFAWRGFVARPADRPNVLLITIDTLRWDRLGAYGARDAGTPVLDGIAARGVRFETAIAQAPLTAPSHASILTGVIPPRHGVRDNGGFALPDRLPTAAEAFRRAGYRTAAFISGFPLDRRFGFGRGFDHYDDRLPRGDDRRRGEYVERRADATTERVLTWLDSASGGTSAADGAARSKPWFVWVHYFDPHTPYEPPPEDSSRFQGRPYDGEIAFVDRQLGRLLGALDRTRIRDRTLVLVTADHGEALGEHGEDTHGVFVYDSTLRVPWIMEGPGLGHALVSGVLARGVDVMPTLLDLAGVSGPDAVDGRSLAPAGRGRAMSEEPAYAESLLPELQFGWAPLYGWRTSRWKVVDAPRRELYAIDADPGEQSNRAESERETTDRLLRQLGAARQVTTPAASVAPSGETAERLRALGYASGTRAARGGTVDPKDRIALANRLWHGLSLVASEPRAAERELSWVLSADPDITIARRYLAMALANRGAFAPAIAEIDQVIRTRAVTADDYRLLGEWKRRGGDAAGAHAAFEEAARRDPSSPDPLLAQAHAALADRDVDGAAALFARVLAMAPGHPEALRGIGEVAMARGDVAGATRQFEQIVASDPGDADARVKLGVLRVRAGRVAEGLALFREAVVLDPGNGEALLTFGGALAKIGRPAEAVTYFERAVAAGVRTTTVFNGLGAARMESGDRAGALSAFRTSLEIDPSQPRIRELMTAIAPPPGRRP